MFQIYNYAGYNFLSAIILARGDAGLLDGLPVPALQVQRRLDLHHQDDLRGGHRLLLAGHFSVGRAKLPPGAPGRLPGARHPLVERAHTVVPVAAAGDLQPHPHARRAHHHQPHHPDCVLNHLLRGPEGLLEAPRKGIQNTAHYVREADDG